VTVTIMGSVPQEGPATNTVVVDPFGQVAEFDEANNMAQTTIVVTPPYTPTPTDTATPTDTPTRTPIPPPGDLAVTKTDSVDPVPSGRPLTYTVVVTNIGFSEVGEEEDVSGLPVGIDVIDVLPEGFLISGFTVNFDGSCLLMGGGELSCHFGVFAPGDTATITITGRIFSATTISVRNTVLVDLPISKAAEAIEVTNNIANEDTVVTAPTPTATPTVTDTPTITPTPTITLTPTITPTPTPMPWPCADFDGDGKVLIHDLLYAVNAYFTADPLADLDGSGLVTVTDILIVVEQYGIQCPA
jgi:hypothetical protein